MKNKLLSALLLAAIALTGCKQKTELTILAPQGAPAVAFYNYANNKNFTTNSVPANIISTMTDNGSDIIVIDTLGGIRAMNNDAPYRLASIITNGNFYIAATGNDDNGTLDSDDKVVLFGRNQTPDKLFTLLYPNHTNIDYVDNVTMASRCLASGKNNNVDVDYVFIAEPILSTVLANTEVATYGKASIYENIATRYAQLNNNLIIPQAGIFVKNGVSEKAVKEFLESIKTDIEGAIANPSVISEAMGVLSTDEQVTKYGIAAPKAISVLQDNNKIGLTYKEAYDYKTDIDEFLKLFNLNETSDSNYYGK